MKNYIIKTRENIFVSVTDKEYFKNRLHRQTELNILSDKKIFKSTNLKTALSNYIFGIVSININLSDCETCILKSCTDSNGIYLIPQFEEKRQLFLSTIYNKLKK